MLALADKSKGRVAHVFGFYGQEELLEKLYEVSGAQVVPRGSLIESLLLVFELSLSYFCFEQDSGYADIRARLAVSLGKFVEKL